MLAWNEPPTSSFAVEPNKMPLGFNRYRFAEGIEVRVSINPSIVDEEVPVTLVIILLVDAGPVNLTLSPARTLNVAPSRPMSPAG